ncbi:uncharacterized protein LOC114750873 [Neltuma alba]|uniref:uncharacterized protein LOC114750873 n=1 Tax=Neltuma alba TaxID=207710 RepID=UPI0010A3A91F|nr:uncharacterized protein LOC114750873 [Prosopis alba]
MIAPFVSYDIKATEWQSVTVSGIKCCDVVIKIDSMRTDWLLGCLECRIWYRWRSCKADLNLDQFNIRVIEPVGFGPFRKVYRCHELDSNRVVAVKEVYAGDESEEVMIDDRIAFLKDCNHQNVVRLLHTLKRGCYLYLVFEYISPNLYYFMNLPEHCKYPKQRNYLLYQILAAVAHYHSHGLLLRDLKPQDLLMDFRDGYLKLGDFGLYGAFGDPEPCDIPVSEYTAPEVLLDSYQHSPASDLWAVGCIFGEIVIGKPLFHLGKSNQDQLRTIFRLLGTPTEESWPGISDLCPTLTFYPKFEPLNLSSKFPDLEPEGIDILSKLLCLDPNNRISAEAALGHAFFNNDLWVTSCSEWGICNPWIVSAPNLEEFHYKVIGEVRNCAFNKVYRCFQTYKERMVFIKEIFIPDEYNVKARRSISAKLNFLRFFHHPNVLRMVDTFSKGKCLYIVYEYFSMDLYHMITLPPVMREAQIKLTFFSSSKKLVLQQILSAVEQYHSYEIIVGDIKPEHLRYSHCERSVKLADFGFAGAFGDPWASYPIKTSRYSAPELLFGTRRFSKAVDMWSVGCIFGEMVIGKAIFQGTTPREQLMSIFRLLGTPTEESWPGVTTMCRTLSRFPKYRPKNLVEEFPGLEPEGIDLLSQMLCLDPEGRISAEEALDHEYFNLRGGPVREGFCKQQNRWEGLVRQIEDARIDDFGVQ